MLAAVMLCLPKECDEYAMYHILTYNPHFLVCCARLAKAQEAKLG
jgi:hypothetical protein